MKTTKTHSKGTKLSPKRERRARRGGGSTRGSRFQRRTAVSRRARATRRAPAAGPGADARRRASASRGSLPTAGLRATTSEVAGKDYSILMRAIPFVLYSLTVQ